MNVPAFAESGYAKNRMIEKIADLADDVEGDYETEDDLFVDVLMRLSIISPLSDLRLYVVPYRPYLFVRDRNGPLCQFKTTHQRVRSAAVLGTMV